jgi:hypothetical protein
VPPLVFTVVPGSKAPVHEGPGLVVPFDIVPATTFTTVIAAELFVVGAAQPTERILIVVVPGLIKAIVENVAVRGDVPEKVTDADCGAAVVFVPVRL